MMGALGTNAPAYPADYSLTVLDRQLFLSPDIGSCAYKQRIHTLPHIMYGVRCMR